MGRCIRRLRDYLYHADQVGDQQNSVLWPRADLLLSVSLSGDINILDPGQSREAQEGDCGTSKPAWYTFVHDGVVVMGDGHGVLCKFTLATTRSPNRGRNRQELRRARSALYADHRSSHVW